MGVILPFGSGYCQRGEGVGDVQETLLYLVSAMHCTKAHSGRKKSFRITARCQNQSHEITVLQRTVILS